MSADRTFVFEIYRDGALIEEVSLDRDVIKIGSHERAHLVIDDPMVSRMHAVIEAGEEDMFIIDLGSGRGTMVNGERINKASLHHKDRIQLGDTELVFNAYSVGATDRGAGAVGGERQKVERIPDTLVYARRFLSKPAHTDGSVEVAMLSNDHVIIDELYKPARDVVIGSGEDADLPLIHPLLTDGDFTLIDCSSGEPHLRFTSLMNGEVYVDKKRYTLDELITQNIASVQGKVASIKLAADVRAKIQFDNISIFVHRTSEATLALPFGEMDSVRLGGFIAGSAIFHSLLLALAFWYPTSLDNLNDDQLNRNDRWVRLITQEEIEEQEEPEWLKDDEGDDSGEEGNADDDSETATDTESEAVADSETTDDVVGELSQAEARDEALNTGALAALKQFGASSTFSSASAGYDNLQFANTNGDVSARYGQQGLGRYSGGIAAGGGGAGGGGVSGGPLAVRGRVSGERMGGAERGISDRSERRVAVTPGTPEIRGQLDREIIQRVIRQHRREVRTCYESQLQANPDLSGRVIVAFVIDPTGAVAGADIGSSTLGNSAVEQCLRTRVTRWRFPEPRGGGIVRVSYPFVFTSG